MHPSNERRNLPRILRHDRVAIQLLRPGEEGPRSGRTINTETLDISQHGLRVRIDHPVESDHYFDLCIELHDHDKIFLLTGEIRWCRPLAEGGFEAGILLHDGEGTDFAGWSQLMIERGEEDASTATDR